MAAYIPPHKRHSKDTNTPSPSPSPCPSPSRLVPKTSGAKNKQPQGRKIVYAKDSISRWFILPCTTDDDGIGNAQLPFSLKLQPFSLDHSNGPKRMVLARCSGDHSQKEKNEIASSFAKSPWITIVEKIQEDLLTSLQLARIEMCSDGPELIQPRFLVRFGKVLFNDSSINVDNIAKSSDVEKALSGINKRFYTNIPNSFAEALLGVVIPRIGVDFDKEEEHYYVQVFDKHRPGATISCKCRIVEAAGELDLYKVELNPVRHLIVDISCVEKNQDLRLLLSSKRILTYLNDDEKHSLNNLIRYAVIDSEAKGGLRWPLGKESLGDRYTVVGVRHIKDKTFKSSCLRLKLRHTDRFDFLTSIGEVTQEASLMIPELTRQLRDVTSELNPLTDMLRDTLKLLWDHFLS